MFAIIISTVAYVVLSVMEKVGEAETERKFKECEETDWNEYYSNIDKK